MLQRNDSERSGRDDETPAVPGPRRRPLSLEARPPCLGPRARELDADAVEVFARWLRAELGLDASTRITVTEWVSLDSREVPHATFVSVTSRSRQLAFSIGKRMEAIEADDLPQSVRRSTRAGGKTEHAPATARKNGSHARSAR